MVSPSPTRLQGMSRGRRPRDATVDAPGGRKSEQPSLLPPNMPNFCRIVVGVDPAATSHAESDETGIIVAGKTMEGIAVVLDDLSGVYSPQEWAKKVVDCYHAYGADRVVAEVNKGGDMVASLLRVVDPALSYKGVHATKNKYTRAEPIAALYEQGKVLHARPFPELEEQLCTYVPGKSRSSPDRLDAMVWALTELMLSPPTKPHAIRLRRFDDLGRRRYFL